MMVTTEICRLHRRVIVTEIFTIKKGKKTDLVFPFVCRECFEATEKETRFFKQHFLKKQPEVNKK